jgi:hypothetical protein
MAAMLAEVAGPPPVDPSNESTSTIVAALDENLSPYMAAGLRHRDAVIWKAFGFTPDAARGWIDEDVPLSQALTWRSVKPEHYHQWVALGIDESYAHGWELRDYTPHDAQHWGVRHSWETLEKLRWVGPAEHVAPLVNEHKMTPEDVTMWVATNIPLADIKAWVKKGYTPKQAMKLHEKGKRVDRVPDLLFGEPFPSHSWKRIAAAARKNGWTIHDPERATSNRYTNRLSVRFERNGQNLYGLFGPNGQFRGVVTTAVARWYPNAHDPGRMRTIDEFIKALHKTEK